jgi:hypothetical protein
MLLNYNIEFGELREIPKVPSTKFVKKFANGQVNYLGIVKSLEIKMDNPHPSYQKIGKRIRD